MFSILEKITEVKDNQIEKIKKTGEATLPVINANLNEALHLFNEIEKNSQKLQEVCNFSKYFVNI